MTAAGCRSRCPCCNDKRRCKHDASTPHAPHRHMDNKQHACHEVVQPLQCIPISQLPCPLWASFILASHIPGDSATLSSETHAVAGGSPMLHRYSLIAAVTGCRCSSEANSRVFITAGMGPKVLLHTQAIAGSSSPLRLPQVTLEMHAGADVHTDEASHCCERRCSSQQAWGEAQAPGRPQWWPNCPRTWAS